MFDVQNTKLQSPNTVMFDMCRRLLQARSVGCHILVDVFVLISVRVSHIGRHIYFALFSFTERGKKFARCPFAKSDIHKNGRFHVQGKPGKKTIVEIICYALVMIFRWILKVIKIFRCNEIFVGRSLKCR